MKTSIAYSLILLCTMRAIVVHGNYIFKINLISFINPTDRTATGECCVCCEIGGVCIDQCDTVIRICLRPAGFSESDPSCPLVELRGPDDPRGINIGVGEPWTGSIQLYIRASHQNGTEDMGDELIDDPLLDNFLIEITNFVANSPSTPILQYIGMFGRIRAQLQFEVVCETNYYGPDCSIVCFGRNDSGGHYRCNQDGQWECLEGYQNVDSNCTECVPADGCSPVGGYCDSPGNCVCHDGWSGPLCSECVPSEGCSTTGGYCDSPGECICRSGYSGDNCSIGLISDSRSSTTMSATDPSPVSMMTTSPATPVMETTSALLMAPMLSVPAKAPVSTREDGGFTLLPAIVGAGVGGFLLLIIILISIVTIVIALSHRTKAVKRNDRGFLGRVYAFSPELMGSERRASSNDGNDHNCMLISHAPNTTLPDATCSTFQNSHPRAVHTQASITENSNQEPQSAVNNGATVIANPSTSQETQRGARNLMTESPPSYDHLLPSDGGSEGNWLPQSDGASANTMGTETTDDLSASSSEADFKVDLQQYLQLGSGDTALTYSTEVQTSFSDFETD